MKTLALALALTQAPPPDADALKRTVQVETAAVERSPDDTQALYRLGLANLALGQAKAAQKPLEQLLKSDPDSLDAVLLLSRAYRQGGELDKAKALLDPAILSHPDEPSLRSERGQVARAQEDATTAVAQYRKAVELSPNDADLLFNLGEALQLSRGGLDEAIGLYRKALALAPDHQSAKVNLGKALAEKGLFGEAKQQLQEACRGALADADAHYNLGVLYQRERDLTQALTEFDRALAINPRHAAALNNVGVAWEARGDLKKAVEAFRKATLADTASAEPWFNLGLALLKLDRTAEASKAFEQALKREPASSGPYVQLGTLYLKQGRRDRAIEAFKKAIAAQDQQEKEASGFRLLTRRAATERTTDAYRGLALAYLALGKVDDAVATLKAAVDKLPKDASARVALGEAYLAQGNASGAVEQFKARLEVEASAEAKLDLARAYTKARIGKEAEALYRGVLADEPGHRAATLGLADLFLTMGRYDDGEQLLAALLKSDPNDALALSRLGILKSRHGRPDQALEPLTRAVELNPLLLDARAEHGFLLFRADSQGHVDRCVATMRDILTADDRHVLALHYLGVCSFFKGDLARAEEGFKAALAVDATFAAAQFSLGELYEHQGKKDEAKKAYEAAAKLGHDEASGALKKLAGGK